MSIEVCLCANTLYYPEGGGHLWVYLNWALGLRALGCRVRWLELVAPATPPDEVQRLAGSLKSRLERYGLGDGIALTSWTDERLAREATAGYLDVDAAAEADLLLNLQYDL